MKLLHYFILFGFLLITSCILLGIVIIIYPAYRWPSPHVYSGAQTTVTEGAVGSWGLGRTQTYKIDQSADTLQTHYELEMARYCIGRWQFTPLPDDNYVRGNWWGFDELATYMEKDSCREAGCPIRRFGMDQSFRILICKDSETHSTVVQVDTWED